MPSAILSSAGRKSAFVGPSWCMTPASLSQVFRPSHAHRPFTVCPAVPGLSVYVGAAPTGRNCTASSTRMRSIPPNTLDSCYSYPTGVRPFIACRTRRLTKPTRSCFLMDVSSIGITATALTYRSRSCKVASLSMLPSAPRRALFQTETLRPLVGQRGGGTLIQ